MSDQEAVRAVALAEANKVVGGSGNPEEVLKVAYAFFDFLVGTPNKPTRSAAGAEPDKKPEAKPSANTANKDAAKKAAKAAAEAEAAKAALEKANAEDGAEDESGPTEGFEATKEGVAAAVAAMISNKSGEGPNRDTAIALLKEFKAASTSDMQKKDGATIAKFIGKVNEAFGFGDEPDLEG